MHRLSDGMNRMNRQLALLKGLNVTYYAANAVVGPYLPLYFAFKGFSAAEIGLLMMTGPFVAIFVQPVWGYVSDRLRTVKHVVALLWGLTLACSVGLFEADGFAWSLLFVTLLYFFLMPSTPLLDSLVIRCAEEAHVSYGSIRMWGSIGYSAFAVVTGGILAIIGGVGQLKWIYWGVWLFPLLLLLFLKDRQADAPPVTLRSLIALAGNKPFLWFLLLVFVMMVPHRMNDTFLVLHMAHLGASEQMAGLAWAIAAFSEAPTFMLLYRYMHKFHDLALLGIVGLLYAVRWTLYALTNDPLLLLVMQASHSITFAVLWLVAIAYAVRVVPLELRSTGQSILAAVAIGVSGIAGGAFGGWIEAWGGFAAAYGAGAVVAGAAGAAFLVSHALGRRGGKRRIAAGSQPR